MAAPEADADADALYGLPYAYPTSVSGVANTYDWAGVSGPGFSSTLFGARSLRVIGKRSADAEADADAYYYGGYGYGGYGGYGYAGYPYRAGYGPGYPYRYGYRYW